MLPVIVELEGYNIWSSEEGELANILKGNQLTIEHRFFDQSVPEGGIPWENLTIKQAADDQHEIIQAIRQKIYPASKMDQYRNQQRRTDDDISPLFFTRPMWISVYLM